MKRYEEGGEVPKPVKPLPKGPQGPRKYVTREERIRREQEQKDKQAEMERKMREAYERVQSQSVSGMKSGGAVKSSASKRADGCAVKGKTRGRMI